MSPSTPTVLLVDDDERLLRSLTRQLETHKYKILTAISAAEADVHLSSGKIDVVVSDHRMPGTTGLDFLNRAKRSYPSIRRIILSGTVGCYSQLDLTRRADTTLEKPCSAETLHSAIQQLLNDTCASAETTTTAK